MKTIFSKLATSKLFSFSWLKHFLTKSENNCSDWLIFMYWIFEIWNSDFKLFCLSQNNFERGPQTNFLVKKWPVLFYLKILFFEDFYRRIPREKILKYYLFCEQSNLKVQNTLVSDLTFLKKTWKKLPCLLLT